MSTCQYNRKLSAYLDGELVEQDREDVARHLAGCGECAGELRHLQAMSRFLGEFEPPAIPDALLRRIHRSVDAAEGIQRMVRLAGSLTTLAATMAVAVTLWHSLSSGNGQAMAGAAGWEQVAVNGDTDSAAPQPVELAVAEWMVSDLSAGGTSRE